VTSVVSDTVGDSQPVARSGRRAAVGRTPASALTLHKAAHLARPRLSHTVVQRRRLSDLVEAGARRAVTVVSGGAGWGKTVLVAAWAEASAARVAWLTLDTEDNDPGAFWADVVAALKAAGAVRAGDALADLARPPRMNSEYLLRLMEGLRRMSGPVVLVIDDFHEIQHREVLDQVAALLHDLPRRLRLVLVTRTEPDLPLHRLRLTGELTEIRTPDLAFRHDEAAELVSRHGLRLADDELGAVLDRTEGWPAGLQLVFALHARRGNGARIDGNVSDMPAIADYLTREVLAEQPSEVRRFLLCTSILDEVCADLADAVTGNRDGQRILEDLERANAFVMGLGYRQRWFRYHHLLRDVLRHQLAVESPELITDLHLRAAHWYVGQNTTLKAIRHAAAGRDWQLVGRLTATWGLPAMVSADRAAMIKVLRRIPAEHLSETPELLVCAALLMFDAGDFDSIPDAIRRAYELLDGPTRWRSIEVVLGTLAGTVNRVRGDMPGLVAATTEVLAHLTATRLADLPSQLQYRAINLGNKGVGLLWMGQADRADRYLWTALTAARASSLEMVEIDSVGHLALLAYLRGSLREAHEYAAEARKLADRRGLGVARPSIAAHLALALVELERNDVAAAERAFDQGHRAYRADPGVPHSVVCAVTQARLLTAQGEHDAARAALRQVRRDVTPGLTAPALKRWQLLTESELDLAAGRPDAVLARYGPRTDDLTAAEAVCLARANLALRKLDDADALATRARLDAFSGVHAVWAWLLSALVADSRGHGNQSVDALAKCLRIAQREGIRRPFHAVGSLRLAALMERQGWLVEQNAGFAAELLPALEGVRSPGPPSSDTHLSERELEVLRFLPTVLTASEIAAELNVSVNTVKAHLRSIYRKLEASRRREAVVSARERGLL
jgi:LuxR family maltose regulon positive regulatory protein